MTNLLSNIVLSLVLSTNWHAVQGLSLEVQLVKKEHTAHVIYAGATNVFLLKTEWEALPGTRPAQRAVIFTTIFTATNSWPNWRGSYLTNVPLNSPYTLELP